MNSAAACLRPQVHGGIGRGAFGARGAGPRTCAAHQTHRAQPGGAQRRDAYAHPTDIFILYLFVEGETYIYIYIYIYMYRIRN